MFDPIKNLFFACLFVSCAFSEGVDLSEYELSLYSQNGEDGVLAKIFQLIGPGSKFCVEFRAHDGNAGSNTKLFRLQGWGALLLDRTFEIPSLSLYKEYVTAENINKLFEKYNVPSEFNLLSIDIDYNDFYVWKAIDEKYRPAVVVIEFNGTHLPTEDKVVKYHPFYSGDGTNYYGASILAFYRLGRSKGYSLIYSEKVGENLFFIRDDLLIEKDLQFKNVNDPQKLYHPPTYGDGPNGGYREDTKKRNYFPSEELLR